VSKHINVRDRTVVTFVLGQSVHNLQGFEVHVSIRDGRLRVEADGPLVVRPAASNAMTIGKDD
jgi:hypothetical protein